MVRVNLTGALPAAAALFLAIPWAAHAGSAGGELAGDGIAERYPGDVGIEHDPRVVFVEDFEKRTPESFKGHWTWAANKAGALSMDSLTPPGSRGRSSIRITAKRGQNSGGYLYKVFEPGYDDLHARMYVRFDPGYGFSHHFCSLGGKPNPPPWPTGGAGLRPKRGFGTGIEPCRALLHTWPPKTYEPPGFWHFYTYWPEMRSWQRVDGRSDGRPRAYYGNNFTSLEPSVIERGKWICVEWAVKLNSDASKRDGAQRFWIDGKLCGNWAPGTPRGYWVRETFRIRPDQPDKQKPFEGIRWRTDDRIRINKFKIENYVSDRSWSHAEEYRRRRPDFRMNRDEWPVWFDHIVVATGYIGPIRSARRREGKPATDPVPGAPNKDGSDQGAGLAAEREAWRIFGAARMAGQMGQRSTARGLYEKIVKEYPGTEAAKKAERELE